MHKHKVAWIAASKRAARSTQVEAAEQWGAITVWEPEHGGVWEFVGSLRPGDIVGVWTCDLLAPPLRKKKGETRKDTFRAVSKAIMEKGAEVQELKTGRTCKEPAHLVEMMLDARDVIAGASGTKAGPGRPKKEYTDAEIKQIAGLWYHKKHRFNKNRLAAVQAEFPKFTMADFYNNRERLEEI